MLCSFVSLSGLVVQVLSAPQLAPAPRYPHLHPANLEPRVAVPPLHADIAAGLQRLHVSDGHYTMGLAVIIVILRVLCGNGY